MGASNVRQSPLISKHGDIKSNNDLSHYILGKNRTPPAVTIADQPQDTFEPSQLHFIPGNHKVWNSPVPLRLPRLNTTKLKRTELFNPKESLSPLLRPFSHSAQELTRPIRTPPLIIYEQDPLLNTTEMLNQRKFKCDQCGIVFPSNEALIKHKTRFCIGVKDSGTARKPVYSDDEDVESNHHHGDSGYTTKRSTGKKAVISYQTPTRKKMDDIHDWKLQRSMRQAVEDMEDQNLIHFQKEHIRLNRIKNQDDIYREILVDYERLQRQEQDVLRQMYDIDMESKSVNGQDPLHESMHKLTINQNDRLEELQRRNKRLEEERRIIQLKLEELISNNYEPSVMPNYQPYKFLREMKEQQELNEKALDFLRGRLIYTNGNLTSFHDAHTLMRQAAGNTIRSSRNNYLQAGGHNADIITRYSDLEYRLRAYEGYPWTKDFPEPLRQSKYKSEQHIDPTNDSLKLVHAENERLQYELDEMQHKFDFLSARTRQLELSVATGRGQNPSNDLAYYSSSDATQSQPLSMYVSESNNNQHGPHPNDQQKSSFDNDKYAASRASPTLSLVSSNMNKLRNPLAPQPYDPSGGFIIFFDFITHLPPSVKTCSIITSIHHPKSGLGAPSGLEPIRCDEYIDDRTKERMAVAVIATKQPVPGCPPQRALSIVSELQTSTKPNAKADDLETNAWAKFALFDEQNRLLSGRWKVPIKQMPVNYNEHFSAITKLPSFGHSELYFRLVNARDDSDQSDAPLSPKYRELYQYPIPYRN